MARIAFIVTTCHEFEGVKVLSSVLKTAGHQTDCFITSEERDFAGAVLRFEPRSKMEVAEASREYLRRKNAVQPVTERSAGCVFKNPDPERSGGKTAGLLVDEAGGKGRRRGDATISDRHGNFLINQGAATAADVFGLIEEIQDLVAQRTGLELECEVKLWRGNGERAAT